jgi:hypothetical protein
MNLIQCDQKDVELDPEMELDQYIKLDQDYPESCLSLLHAFWL